MASLDKLSIDITASANGATKAIGNIVRGLTNLSTRLDSFGSNSKSIQNVEAAFDAIANSINKIDSQKLKTVNSSLRGMAYAVDKLGNTAKILDMSPATQQARALESALDKATQALCNEFGINGKQGVNAVKEALQGAVSTYQQLLDGTLNAPIDVVWKDTERAIKENIDAVDEFRVDYSQLLDYMKAQNSSGRKVYLPFDPQDIGDDYTRLRSVLGKAFTSDSAFASVGDITSFVTDLNAALGTTIPIAENEADTFMNLVQALKQARGEMSNTESYTKAMIAQEDLSGIISNTVASLHSEQQAIASVEQQAEMPVQGNAIDQIVNSLKGFEGVQVPESQSIADLAKNIAKFNNKGVEKAVENLPKVTKVLSQSLQELSKAPEISQSVIDMTNALANYNKTASRTGTSSKPLIASFKDVSYSAKKAGNSFKGLASSIGLFYAKFFLIIRGVKALWSAIGSSMDFVETYNYFGSAIDQVASKATGDWAELGYESEEAYENSFRKASLDLTKKMSGYLVGDDGLLISANDINLGLDPNKMLAYQSQFAQMASSMNVASDEAIKLSNALTMIGADLASVKNMEFEDVWSNMASGMVGMSRAVDKYGINLREAALNEELMRLGIDTTVKQLSGADKALLRTITIIDSSRYAWHDLADTIEQPRNQIRMLENNWTSLCRNVGNIFAGWVNSMLPYINALVIALQRLAQWIINVFSISIPSSSKQGQNDISDLADEIYGAGDALDSASGSAKKLKNNLLGIDELNVLNNDDNGGSGSGGSVASNNAALQEAFDELFRDYQEAWDEAFNNVDSKAQDMANAIVDAFKKGDYKEIGTIISTKIRDALDSIPWDSIYNVAKNFGTNFANFLNGLIKPDTFYSVGKTLAGALNTAFYFLGEFASTFDWKNLGLSLASGLQGLVDNIDAAYWGRAISNAFIGILESVKTFLANAPWFEIGQKIGTFLANINWGKILLEVAKVAILALNGLLHVIAGMFDANGLVGLIMTGIIGFVTLDKVLGIAGKFYSLFTNNNVIKLFTNAGSKAGESLSGGISTGWSSKIATLKDLATTDLGTVFGAGTFAEKGAVLGMGLVGGITAAVAGFNLGEYIAVHWLGEDTANLLSNNWDTLWEYVVSDRGEIAAIGAQNQYVTEACETMQLYNERLYAVSQAINFVDFDDANSELYKYNETGQQTIEMLDSQLTALGQYGVALNDYQAIQDYVNDSTYNGTDATRNYLLALSEQYDQLSVTEKMLLQTAYGIDYVYSETDKLGGNNGMPSYVAQTLRAQEAQKALGSQVSTTASTVNTSVLSLDNYSNAVGNCSGAILGLQESMNYLDYASTQVAHNGMPSYVAEIMASSSASSQLATDLSNLSSVTESTTAYFDVANSYVSAMTDSIFAMSGDAIPTLQLQFEDLGSTINKVWRDADSDTTTYTDAIYNTVSTTEANMLEDLNTNLDTAQTNISTILANIELNVKTVFANMQTNVETVFDNTITNVESKVSDAMAWFDNNIVPQFSESRFDEILGGIPKAFETAFRNACNVVVGIMNELIDEINDAMDISWDAVEVGGKKVVEAGSAKVLDISHIRGFAQGGFPTSSDLFYANENGRPEYVGSFGNKTAVANNDQIVAGITNGVRSAVAEVMMPYLSQIADNTRETANKDFSVNIGDRDIARANVRGQRSMGRTLISTT